MMCVHVLIVFIIIIINFYFTIGFLCFRFAMCLSAAGCFINGALGFVVLQLKAYY